MLALEQKSKIEMNALTLGQEIAWFKEILKFRMAPYARQNTEYQSLEQIPAPKLSMGDSPYARLVLQENLSEKERVIVLLALIGISQKG